MQLFPEKIRGLWNGWEIRVLVLLSLSLQTFLTLFGSRRKITARIWVQFLIWLAYLSADWVATVVLGNLATSDDRDVAGKSQKSNDKIQAFWAPFLLLHLGGPDTITAYSLEDNELWLRHLLALLVQVSVAFYVYLRSWSNTVLTYLTVPMFIIGTIKYGERTLVLKSSSKDNIKNYSLLNSIPHPSSWDNGASLPLVEKYFLFKNCALLFAGQVLGLDIERDSRKIIKEKSFKDAFEIVAVELGFMYDLLYTKAKVVYTRWGILVRCFSLASAVSVLVIFSVTIDIHAYPPVDILITYLLLAGAIVLDLCAFILHFFSDWTKLHYVSKYKNANRLHVIDSFSISHPILGNHKRWLSYMGQFNLISSYLEKKMPAAFAVVGKLPAVDDYLENLPYLTWTRMDDDVQELIFSELTAKMNIHTEGIVPFWSTEIGQKVMAQRGDYVLEERYKIQPKTGMPWFTASDPFDRSLLVWHIATALCYYDDLERRCQGNANNLPLTCKISRCLSDYMMYLSVFCPSLMPEGSGDSRYKQTRKDLDESFESKDEARLVLLRLSESPGDSPGWVVHSMAKAAPSMLAPGYLLARQLKQLESTDGWDYEKKWKMVSEIWVEMLAYAASHGVWSAHGQRLRKGGELLTHVRVLMAHLGFSSQYGLVRGDDWRFTIWAC